MGNKPAVKLPETVKQHNSTSQKLEIIISLGSRGEMELLKESMGEINSSFIEFKLIEDCDKIKSKINANSKNKSTTNILVLTGQKGENLKNFIDSNENILSVFVYCFDLERHEQWAKKISKIKCITNNFKLLKQKIIFHLTPSPDEDIKLEEHFIPFDDEKKNITQLYLMLKNYENIYRNENYKEQFEAFNDFKNNLKKLHHANLLTSKSHNIMNKFIHNNELSCDNTIPLFIEHLAKNLNQPNNDNFENIFNYITSNLDILDSFNNALKGIQYEKVFEMRFFLFLFYKLFEINSNNQTVKTDKTDNPSGFLYGVTTINRNILNEKIFYDSDAGEEIKNLIYNPYFIRLFKSKDQAEKLAVTMNSKLENKEKITILFKLNLKSISYDNIIMKPNKNKNEKNADNAKNTNDLEEDYYLLKNNNFFKVVTVDLNSSCLSKSISFTLLNSTMDTHYGQYCEIELNIIDNNIVWEILHQNSLSCFTDFQYSKNQLINEYITYLYLLYIFQRYNEVKNLLDKKTISNYDRNSYFLYDLYAKTLFYNNKKEKVLDYFKQAKSNCIKNYGENFINSIISGHNIAIYYFNKKQYSNCLDIVRPLKKKLKNSSMYHEDKFDEFLRPFLNIASVYNTIGNAYLAENNFKKAKPKFIKALIFIKKDMFNESCELQHKIYFNLGICFYNLKQYQEAKNQFHNCLVYLAKIDNKSKLSSTVYVMLSLCFKKMNEIKNMQNNIILLYNNLNKTKSKNLEKFSHVFQDIFNMVDK